ncbi:winged helix DNA-binding domain-containing protein [soil metagenome]
MSQAKLNWRQVMAWRVQRHHLDERVPKRRALDVVGDIGCLHAQLMSSAELALWARVDKLKRNDVEKWLWTDRRLVKTWAMRGTLHLLKSDEYQLWRAGLGTYKHYLKPAWFKAFRVTEKELEELIAAISRALDGRTLTRDELAQRISKITKSDALADKLRGSWGAMLKPASFQGRLCFGPNKGRNVSFARPDQWLGLNESDAIDPTEALEEITRRFLSAYGPATREDLARWWAVSPAAGGRFISGLGDEVVPVGLDGGKYWALTETLDEMRAASPTKSVRLLPGFDPYIIGSTTHAAKLMSGDFKARVHRPQGWVSPVLLVDGRIDGVWRHERKGKRLMVDIEPFASVPKWVVRGAEQEAEGLASFMGAPLELTWLR